jgi:hypothetical protein
MIPNRTAQADVVTGFTAEVIDFAAHKARRLDRKIDRAAHAAAAALADIETGHGSWAELAAALVAPFNN